MKKDEALTDQKIIDQTINWIKSVVIGCNFCPFAAKPMLRQRIRYVVYANATVAGALEQLAEAMRHLDRSEETETTFIMLPHTFADFEEYLDLIFLAEALCEDLGYQSIYQIASFHPEYCFQGAKANDAANYTNRSIYPMIHILRQDSVSIATEHFPDLEGIPDRNIEFARQKGLSYMRLLREGCM